MCISLCGRRRVLSIFFSKRIGKQLHTNSCSRTKRLDEAGADKVTLSQIAKESVPTKKVDLKGGMLNGLSWWQILTLSVGLLLIVALVIFIVRKSAKMTIKVKI